MPEELITGVESLPQLCAQGCPASDRISTSQHLQYLRKIARSQASEPGKLYSNEIDARSKCKHILLSSPGQQPVRDGLTSNTAPPVDENHSPHSSSSSLASSVFSSLQSKTDSIRMAAASRPLPSSDRTGSLLDVQRSSRRRRRKRKKRRNGRKRDKRNADTQDEGSNPSLHNFYFESCVFDLVTTGDVNFTLAARAALEDVTLFHEQRQDAPGADMEVVRRWDPSHLTPEQPPPGERFTEPPPNKETTTNNAAAKHTSWTLLLICVATSFFCTFYASSFNASNRTVTKFNPCVVVVSSITSLRDDCDLTARRCRAASAA